MEKWTEVLVATTNKGKIREFEELLARPSIKLRDLSYFSSVVEVAETGATFTENAVQKACGYALQTSLPTIADDSGLEVAALKNAPGVFSARYGGTGLSDAERAEKLLAELKKMDVSDRRARFVCVIVLASETGEVYFTANGMCHGQIAAKPSGTKGFGYDSIFIPDGFDATFGELPFSIKQKISHRAQAANEIMRFLQDFLQN